MVRPSRYVRSVSCIPFSRPPSGRRESRHPEGDIVRARLGERLNAFLFQLHIQAESADLVRQYVEARGRAGLERVLALDHGLVNLRAALDVVRLDGEQ